MRSLSERAARDWHRAGTSQRVWFHHGRGSRHDGPSLPSRSQSFLRGERRRSGLELRTAPAPERWAPRAEKKSTKRKTTQFQHYIFSDFVSWTWSLIVCSW